MSNQIWDPITVDKSFVDAPESWLAAQANEGMRWLLVHADDGVIWGKVREDGVVALSGELFNDPDKYPTVAVELRAITIQQARLFGLAGELLVWRVDEGFAVRRIEDGDRDLDSIDETYLLWHMGNPTAVDEEAEFALLQEGQRGNRHAPPVIPHRRRPRVRVRHYIGYDDQGQAYIGLSRLVNLEV